MNGFAGATGHGYFGMLIITNDVDKASKLLSENLAFDMTYVGNASVEASGDASVVVQNDRVIHSTHEDRCVQVQVLQNDFRLQYVLKTLKIFCKMNSTL